MAPCDDRQHPPLPAPPAPHTTPAALVDIALDAARSALRRRKRVDPHALAALPEHLAARLGDLARADAQTAATLAYSRLPALDLSERPWAGALLERLRGCGAFPMVADLSLARAGGVTEHAAATVVGFHASLRRLRVDGCRELSPRGVLCLLAGLPLLETLSLPECGVQFSADAAHTQALCALTRLTRLDVGGNAVEPAAAARIAASLALRLEAFSCWGAAVDGRSLAALGPAVRELDVRWTRLSDAGAEALGGGALTELSVSYCDVGDAAVFALLPRLGQLQVLRACNTSRLSGRAVAALAAAASGLRELDVAGTAKLMRPHLAALARLPALTVLNVSWTAVDDLRPLAAQLPALRELRAADTPVGDVGAQGVAGLPALRTLDLSGTEVTTATAQFLRAAATLDGLLPELADVRLARCLGLTTAAGAALARLPGLRRLDVSGCARLGTGFASELRLDELLASETLIFEAPGCGVFVGPRSGPGSGSSSGSSSDGDEDESDEESEKAEDDEEEPPHGGRVYSIAELLRLRESPMSQLYPQRWTTFIPGVTQPGRWRRAPTVKL